MGGTFTNLQYHIVFSTKKRKSFISEPLRTRLYEYIGGTIRKYQGVLYQIGGTPDHVHLLLRCGPDHSLSEFVRVIKAGSSGWVHKTFPDMQDFCWQDGYGAFSVSLSQSETIKAYILKQEEHHRSQDFKSEFRKILSIHHIDFNEEYLWS